MKDFFEDLGKKLSETAESVSKKTEEVVEIQKLKSQIRTMERNNDRDIFDLGKMVLETYKSGDVIDTEGKSLCESVLKRESVIDHYEEQIAQLRGLEICPACLTHIERTMTYCPKCGTKVREESPEEDLAHEKTCEETESCEEKKTYEETETQEDKGSSEIVNEVKEAIKEAKKAFTEEINDIVTKTEDIVDAVEAAIDAGDDEE